MRRVTVPAPAVWCKPGYANSFPHHGQPFYHASFSHNQRATTFQHPVTAQISPENISFNLQERPGSSMSKVQLEKRPASMVSDSSTAVTSSTVNGTTGPKASRSIGKVHSFGKREQAIKRNPNMPVVVRGWLYKQDSSGMRLWKRKWFVLSDYCLFYYKDSREETVLGSIPLPSYVIALVGPEDHISRKYAFKASHTGMRSYIYNRNSVIGSQAEHSGMRTYYFSADTQEDMNGWIRAMNQAALMQGHAGKREAEPADKSDRQAGPQTNHISIQQRRPSHPEEECISLHRETPEGQTHTKSLAVDGVGEGNGTVTYRDPAVGPIRVHRNGLAPEQNGGVAYKRAVAPEKRAQRTSTLAEVEHWVKVQKGEPRSLPHAEHTLPRRTPPTQPKTHTYQSLPKAARDLPSDYKYAQDRLSHLRMSSDERAATKEGAVWQLLEWQQRQQFRHGSPTAPPRGFDQADGPTPYRTALEVPRSISVPPSPSDIPPPGPPSKGLSPRRPHTPAERVTVRPLDQPLTVDVPPSSSPGRPRPHVPKTAQVERRSMPPVGYITHTVSAPSLHGKTADDTYVQLKKDLEYLDLKVTGRETPKERPAKPVKVAESDVDVKLCRLCEQDRVLQELEAQIRTLKEDKDKLESVLDVSHQQMEQYRDQPGHAEKIAYQQRLLQEDVVHIRAEISQVSTEMENAWKEYEYLEVDVQTLGEALQEKMSRSTLSQLEKTQVRKELWRIEDVLAGLSSSKANYQVTIESVKNPERKLVPSATPPTVPSLSVTPPTTVATPPGRRASQQPLPPQGHATSKSVPKRAEEDAPPRPPLPQIYNHEDMPPAVPPLPRESSVIRHTSVRGLKRQSDERKRDREISYCANGDYRGEMRSYQSEPELLGVEGQIGVGYDSGFQTLPSKGLAGSTSRLHQSSNISSFVTLRRDAPAFIWKERPKSALERLYSGEPRGRMSADEQLERMKRHQKALVRERKRTLSQGERHSAGHRTSSACCYTRPLSADLGSWRREQEFDLQLLEQAVHGRDTPGDLREKWRPQSDEWLTARARPMRELDLEPLDYNLDIIRELSKPQKVLIPERYVDLEPEEPLSQQEMEARYRKVERIQSILAKSSVQNIPPPPQTVTRLDFTDLDQALQEQERIITMSYALASEASMKSKQVADRDGGECLPASQVPSQSRV